MLRPICGDARSCWKGEWPRRILRWLEGGGRKGDASPFIDSDLPYEEWLAVIRCGQDLFPTSTAKVLKILAREHSDDGARFNAVMLLDEARQLEIADLEAVLTRETDPDAQQALLELRE